MSYYEQQARAYNEESIRRIEQMHEKYTLEIDRLHGQLRRERIDHAATKEALVEAQKERIQLIKIIIQLRDELLDIQRSRV